MTRCYACKSERLRQGTESVSRRLAGHTFSAEIPLEVCDHFGESTTNGPDLGRFELRIADALLSAGVHSGNVLFWARKTLGYRAADLGRRLDAAPETISRWENDARPAPPDVVAVLGALVRDALVGSTATRDALELYEELRRRARRRRESQAAVPLPHLWALTPTLSEARLAGFGARPRSDLPPGFFALPAQLGTSIVVIAALPVTPATLWLRLLGRGEVQRRAFDELAALPGDHPLRSATARRVLRWRTEASELEVFTEADKELLMNSECLVQQWEKRGAVRFCRSPRRPPRRMARGEFHDTAG